MTRVRVRFRDRRRMSKRISARSIEFAHLRKDNLLRRLEERYSISRKTTRKREKKRLESHWDPRRGAPSVTHQAPRFPLVQEQGPKTNKTSSTTSQRQCLIDLRPTRALGKFTTENVAISVRWDETPGIFGPVDLFSSIFPPLSSSL